MIDDILYDPLFMVFEVPDVTPGGEVSGLSYDGDNFIFTESVPVETVTIFVA